MTSLIDRHVQKAFDESAHARKGFREGGAFRKFLIRDPVDRRGGFDEDRRAHDSLKPRASAFEQPYLDDVISGDADKVCLILRRRPELMFAVVASDQTSSSDCLNLFDLAVKHNQSVVLQTLLREAARSDNNDHLETFLAKTDSVAGSLSGSELINEVIKHNSKTNQK